jgi:hypothetical protein
MNVYGVYQARGLDRWNSEKLVFCRVYHTNYIYIKQSIRDWHGEDTGFSLDLIHYRIRLEASGEMARQEIRCSRFTHFIECLERAGFGVVVEKGQRQIGGQCTREAKVEEEGDSY